MEDDHIDLGPCCACRTVGPTVRNVMMLALFTALGRTKTPLRAVH